MLLNFTHLPNIFIICGKTDLRKGIDGLAAFVTETYQLDVFDQALFLFVGQSPIVLRRFTGKAMDFYYCTNGLKTTDFTGQNTHQKLTS